MRKIILFIIINILSFSEYSIIENEVLYIFPCTAKYNELIGVKVEGADIKTFDILDGSYAKDKKTIYYKGKKLRKADAETFSAYYGARLEEPIIHYEGKIMNKK